MRIGVEWFAIVRFGSEVPMLRGVFPVLSSPFHPDGGCDPQGLRALVRYVARAGAHGAVYPAIASEFATLSSEERRAMVDVVLDEAGRQDLPVIVGISADAPATSAALARQAAAGGAVALMLMAPRSAGTDATGVAAFFAASIEGAGGLPVILQNAPPPLGSTLSVEAVRDVLAATPSIGYVKEENVPCGQRISALVDARIPSVLGVMGGAGGRFVLDEYARGACGSMPACEAVEIHVAIWDAVQAGDDRRARALFNRVLPLLNMGGVFRQSVVKHVLARRGLIASDRFRDANPPLDAFDRRELDAIVDDLADLLTVPAEPVLVAAQ
jgi:4-hydroxy-tetrahydrodipicolinate synthase